jgi:hypothetical protein
VTRREEEQGATPLAGERRGAPRGGVSGWLRGAVLLADTSRNTSTASASTSSPPTQTVAATVRIVEAKALGSRITDLTIESPAVGGPVQVRLTATPLPGRVPTALAGPVSAARLLRHIRELDPIDRHRAAQP